MLALLCKDEACAYVRSAEDGNSNQAWQALLRARTARNATNLLNMLLDPIFTSPDPRIDLRRWNKNAEEYATRTSERESDGIRRAVYMNKIAPQDMRQHLMLNQTRLNTAEDVAQEIEDSWDATEKFSRDEKNQAGFVAPVGKGFVRQEKGGKHGGKSKGKGKLHKDSDSNPSVVSRDVLEDTAIGAGELATKSRSVGLSKSMQRTIQGKTHCKETFVNGRAHLRKGKVTTNPKVKVKVKVKVMARDNIQEQETRIRTRLDLQTKKMDSASWMTLV